MAQEKEMTTAEVAKELGVSAATVRRLAERGLLAARPVSPALQRAKSLKYARSEVMQYKKELAKK